MAGRGTVFKQELNWSTFQDNQLKILKNIEIALGKSVSHSSESNKNSLDLNKLLGKAIDAVNDLARVANNWSTISNQFIGISGNDGDSVRKFRAEVVGIVRDINDDIGKNYYNAQESYKQLVAISQGVTSNVGAIEEMSRPLLLAQETLDVNINHVADVFNKFYTRYSLSSQNMETIVNDIRGNTAGNSATAEATMKNISSLEGWISQYAAGDTEKITAMTNSISHYTSWLESMNMDSERYTGLLDKIAWGDFDAELAQILNAAGSSMIEAQDLLRSGDWEGVTKLLSQGEHNIFQDISESRVSGKVVDARSLSREMRDTYLAFESENFKGLEEFIASQTSDKTAIDIVGDKYISITDRISNGINEISYHLADFQEKSGIGIDDISIGLTSIFSAMTTYFAYRKVAGIAAGAASAGGVGAASAGAASAASKILPTLGGIASSLGVGGMIAGGLAAGGLILVAKGIFDTVKNIKENNADNFKNLNDIAKGISDNKMTMMQEKITINDKGEIEKSYEMALVDKSEFDQALHEENLWKSFEKDKKDSTWLQKLSGNNNAYREYQRNKKATEFMNSLDSVGKQLFSAYNSKGLVTSLEQLEFLINNFDEISKLSEQGLAVELSKKGLKNPVDRMTLLGYAQGTNYIDRNQLAILHEGEAVTPKRYNPAANMNELESLREYYKNSQNQMQRQRDNTSQYLVETVEVLSEIKEFLSQWKEDNIKRDMTKSHKDRFNENRTFMSRYLAFDS